MPQLLHQSLITAKSSFNDAATDDLSRGFGILQSKVESWERNGSESKEVRFLELLFADDTTIVGTKEEMDGGVNAMKEVIGKFEERSNDQKEECLDFCME